MPASTIQLCGAEKALFRALKKKHDTPKYGLIYHSSLVGRATAKVKGRVRMITKKQKTNFNVSPIVFINSFFYMFYI